MPTSTQNILSRLDPESRDLVKKIGALAEYLEMRAYLVGGPVRDLILKESKVDLDISVEGAAMRLAQRVASQNDGKAVCYPAFKTATVTLDNGQKVDFATARRETYTRGGAFPAVKPAGIRDDLFRRDFTVNAMALAIHPKEWDKVLDPFGGLEDLRAKKIRVLHDNSFVDDPTRILRAARFKARLGFSIEAHTLKLLRSAAAMKVLETIKPQRYLKDFNKILSEPNAQEAIEILKSWNAYKE